MKPANSTLDSMRDFRQKSIQHRYRPRLTVSVSTSGWGCDSAAVPDLELASHRWAGTTAANGYQSTRTTAFGRSRVLTMVSTLSSYFFRCTAVACSTYSMKRGPGSVLVCAISIPGPHLLALGLSLTVNKRRESGIQ
jgi:hypothetical protein